MAKIAPAKRENIFFTVDFKDPFSFIVLGLLPYIPIKNINHLNNQLDRISFHMNSDVLLFKEIIIRNRKNNFDRRSVELIYLKIITF